MYIPVILPTLEPGQMPFREHAPALLAGATLIIAGVLLFRWLQQNRKNNADLAAAIVNGVGAVLAIIWGYFKFESQLWLLLGFIALACVLAGVCVLFLPSDFGIIIKEDRGSSGESRIQCDAKSARVLISYLQSRGRIGEEDTPERLGKAQLGDFLTLLREVEAQSASKAIEPGLEAKFYLGYAQLVNKAHPVTVESLKYCEPRSGGRARAALSLDVNGRFMLASVFLLVLSQAYTTIGVKLQNQMITAHNSYLEAFAKAPSPDTKEEAPTAPRRLISPTVQKDVDEAYAALKAWVRPVSEALEGMGIHRDPPSTEEPKSASPIPPLPGDAAAIRTQAALLLDFFSTYLLPLLYGWAGAMVYVVRRLTTEVRDLTFRADNFAVRAWLGCIAGLAIGWFYPATTTTAQAGAVTNLGPLALAFLAGFGVEILFSMLDRFVKVFTDSQADSAPGK